MSRQLQALRGLAILVVVLTHSIFLGALSLGEMGQAAAEGWRRIFLLAVYELNHVPVPAFLFVSGCFVAYSARGDPPRLPFATIVVSVKRILWPYVIWSIVSYVVLFLVKGESYSVMGYIKNLLVGYPYHFIPILVFFYLVSPVLVRLSKSLGWYLLALVALYQLFLIIVQSPQDFGLALPEWVRFFTPPGLRGTMAQWAVFFPMGLLYSLNAKTMRPQLQHYRWYSLASTLVLYAISLVGAVIDQHIPLVDVLLPVAFLLFFSTVKRNSIPLVRRLEELGNRSYGLYLIHLIVLVLLLYVIQMIAVPLLRYPIMLTCFLFVTALAVPLLLMHCAARLLNRTLYRRLFG